MLLHFLRFCVEYSKLESGRKLLQGPSIRIQNNEAHPASVLKMFSNVFVEGTSIGGLDCPLHPSSSDVLLSVQSALNLAVGEFYLTQNGKRLSVDSRPCPGAPVRVHLRALGGKGGFGSMLRAIGAQIEKTTNREACRDLSGRRLRDINEEKQLKTWLEKQQEREEEAAGKKSKKIEKLQAKPKHDFKDEQYFNARSNLEQTVSEALEEGLKHAGQPKGSGSETSNEAIEEVKSAVASGSGTKRKAAQEAAKAKKKKKVPIKGALWIDDDISLGSSSSDSSDSDSSASAAGDKKKVTRA